VSKEVSAQAMEAATLLLELAREVLRKATGRPKHQERWGSQEHAKILLHKSEMCEIQVIFYFDRHVISWFVEASQNCVYNSTTLPKATCTDLWLSWGNVSCLSILEGSLGKFRIQ
jgi:hypothetical protein